jgi:glutaredoxin
VVHIPVLLKNVFIDACEHGETIIDKHEHKETNTYINRYTHIYLNNHVSMPTLFVDDMSIIYTNSKLPDLKNGINTSFFTSSNWLETNLLSLNYNKTHCMQFITKTN